MERTEPKTRDHRQHHPRHDDIKDALFVKREPGRKYTNDRQIEKERPDNNGPSEMWVPSRRGRNALHRLEQEVAFPTIAQVRNNLKSIICHGGQARATGRQGHSVLSREPSGALPRRSVRAPPPRRVSPRMATETQGDF